MVTRLRQTGTVLVLVGAIHLVVSAQRSPAPDAEGQAIRLKTATFTPTRGERPLIAPGLRAPAARPGQRASYLVQFEGPILEAWKQEVTDTGAEILEYIPDFAFKVGMNPEQANEVSRLASVAWVDVFEPAYKIGPEVARGVSPRVYTLRLEPGADVAAATAAVEATGARVVARSASRITVIADTTRLDAIARVVDIASIETFQLPQKHSEYAGGIIMGADLAHASGFDGSSQTIAIADTGLGHGTVGSGHVGLPPNRLSAIFNWPGAAGGCFATVLDDGAADVSSGHGTHTSIAAAGAGGPAGEGRGTAPAATVVFQALENWAVPSSFCSLVYGIGPNYYLTGIPSDLRLLFQEGYDAGARVHSNSWGSEVAGAYTSDSAELDDFVWHHRDMTITFSAGNAGTDVNADGVVDSGSLAAPGTAKNAITVGASENDRQWRWDCDPSLSYTDCASSGGQNNIFTYGAAWPARFPAAPLLDDPSAGNKDQMAAFSSRGPTDDGRIKPDVVAPGTWVLSGYSNDFQQQYDAGPNPQNGQYQYDGWGSPLNRSYKYMGGTSMANPLVAGAAAVVRDFFQKTLQHNASAALVKATLINSAVDLLDENNDGIDDNAFPIPNAHEGWGRVNLAAALDTRRRIFDEVSGLSTNTSWTTASTVRAGSPIKVTLVWSDAASSTAAAKNLVNDLDLRITSPGGVVYVGNAFSGGWSQSPGTADRTNNVENVFVAAPTAGAWVVEVRGFNVPYGPQPFALVIDGDLDGPPMPRPTVTVAAGSAAREAGLVPGTFTIARTGDTASPLTVSYSTSGTAAPGRDYLTLLDSVTIAAGSDAALVVVTPVDDADVEPDETVALTLKADPAYSVGLPAEAVVTIVSNDAYPDLVVSSLTVPARGAPGEAIAVVDTTRNQGAGDAASSVTTFYLSTNATLDAADASLGSRLVPPLAAGSTHTASTTLTIPGATLSGSYYVLAQADGPAAVTESTETNNGRFSSGLAIGPDLTVSALSAPATSGAGLSLVVTDSTSNLGTAPVPSTVTTFYLSTNVSVDVNDVALGQRSVGPLAAGAADTASTTLTLPSAVATGTYYVIGQADTSAVVAETSESNNTRYSTPLRIGPDLAISVLTVPGTAGAGGTIVVSDTTQNSGGGAAPPSTTTFSLSSLASGAVEVALGSREVAALNAGAAEAASTTLTIPATTPTGTYYVLARTDGVSAVVETTETNNVRFSGAIQIGPDLVVSTLTAPSTAGAGAPLVVTDTTKNQGASAATASATVFYLSANATLDATDVALGNRAVAALTAGASETGSTSVLVPLSTPTGTYYVLAQTDGTAMLAETSEANNVRSSAPVQVGPDLLVTTLTAPQVAGAGASIVMSETTRNQGGGASPASTTTFYLSSNPSFDAADLALGSRPVVVLAAGSSEAASATLTVPEETTTGSYYVIAKADGASAVVETVESNNTRVSAMVRVGPDLIVSALTVPTSVVGPGSSIVVTDTSRNQGGGVAPPSVTALYLSTNTTLDAGDLSLGVRAVSALAAGAVETASTTIIIPATTVGGTYYILAAADANATVTETIETNNSRAGWMRIGP